MHISYSCVVEMCAQRMQQVNDRQKMLTKFLEQKVRGKSLLVHLFVVRFAADLRISIIGTSPISVLFMKQFAKFKW